MDTPLFTSTREAVRFAINHHVALPRPVMNKMMADGAVQRIELADGTKITVAAPRSPRSGQLKGMDGAATAGIVLAHVARLPDAQQLVVMGRTMMPTLPCSCRAPCCQGFKINPAWANVLTRICEHLKNEAQLSKVPGKKGLSTSPMLRTMLVQKFLQPKMDMTGEEIATKAGITIQTVIAHRRPILKFLEEQESKGWHGLDLSMSQAGLVGFIP